MDTVAAILGMLTAGLVGFNLGQWTIRRRVESARSRLITRPTAPGRIFGAPPTDSTSTGNGSEPSPADKPRPSRPVHESLMPSIDKLIGQSPAPRSPWEVS